jgi:integrase
MIDEDYLKENINKYNTIKEKVNQTNNIKLIYFVDLALDLCMRSRDILKLQWNQIDFENKIIIDAYRTQKSEANRKTVNLELTKHDLFLGCEHIIDDLKKWYDKTKDKEIIFPNYNTFKINDSLRILLKDNKFYSHQLRGIGLTKKLYDLKGVNHCD